MRPAPHQSLAAYGALLCDASYARAGGAPVASTAHAKPSAGAAGPKAGGASAHARYAANGLLALFATAWGEPARAAEAGRGRNGRQATPWARGVQVRLVQGPAHGRGTEWPHLALRGARSHPRHAHCSASVALHGVLSGAGTPREQTGACVHRWAPTSVPASRLPACLRAQLGSAAKPWAQVGHTQNRRQHGVECLGQSVN